MERNISRCLWEISYLQRRYEEVSISRANLYISSARFVVIVRQGQIYGNGMKDSNGNLNFNRKKIFLNCMKIISPFPSHSIANVSKPNFLFYFFSRFSYPIQLHRKVHLLYISCTERLQFDWYWIEMMKSKKSSNFNGQILYKKKNIFIFFIFLFSEMSPQKVHQHLCL